MLTILYHKSYESDQIPMDWKRAEVTPAFNNGSKTAACNYRPISLTCIACKIMEHIPTRNIVKHASKNNILYELQHGLRKQFSCETPLLEFQSDLLQNVTDGKQSDVLILNLSKAFDKVGHKRSLFDRKGRDL